MVVLGWVGRGALNNAREGSMMDGRWRRRSSPAMLQSPRPAASPGSGCLWLLLAQQSLHEPSLPSCLLPRRWERGEVCGRGRTWPGRGSSARLPIHLGRILPWISAGKFGLRLLGCPGRRGQGSRPEAPRHDSPSLRWKSAFSSPRLRPELPDTLCARRGSGSGRAGVGLMREGVFGNDPKTQPSGSQALTKPGSSWFYFWHGFLAVADFSLKKWFPSLVARLSL